MDLTEAILNIPCREFIEPAMGDYTAVKLEADLERFGIKYERRSNGKYNLTVCPFCQHDEGNPAVGLRDGRPWFRCNRANHCGDKKYRDLEKLNQPRSKLARINAADLVQRYLSPRKQVILGLLRCGDVMNVIGGPKARKSFLVMQLALSIAAGIRFLGWDTIPGRVLLVDNELRGDDLARRMKAMAEAMGLDWAIVSQNIDIMPLRGKLADINAIRNELTGLQSETYTLVVFDALYKALPANVDENSNSNITQCYVTLDDLAEKHNCAIVVVHHSSKGAQHQKSVSDMGSGAGAQRRSADVHCVLREHEEADTVVLQAIVRSQKPVEPTCLTFDYPLWHLSPEKSPSKVAATGKKPLPTVAEFLDTIPTEPTHKKEALEASWRRLDTSKPSIEALFKHCLKEGLIEEVKPANKSLPHTVRRIEKPNATN